MTGDGTKVRFVSLRPCIYMQRDTEGAEGADAPLKG